jgi:RNA polymerase sigma-70 factor (ECF subfamily)
MSGSAFHRDRMADIREYPEEQRRLGSAGDSAELADLFVQNRERLVQMIRLRIDQRLLQRIDASDVIQESYLECVRRYDDYRENPKLPLFLWVRLQTNQKLVDLHRGHLGAQMRDVGREAALNHGAASVSSAALAEQLLGRLTTASKAAIRKETQLRVQDALSAMDAIDREVLTLRHFEMLTNEETASVLGISKTAASNRYIRALMRMKKIATGIPGLDGE